MTYVILDINADFRLTTDERNVTIEKRRIRKDGERVGEEYWTSEAHFSTVPQAARWLINQHSRDYQGSDIHKLTEELHQLYGQIEQACKVTM